MPQITHKANKKEGRETSAFSYRPDFPALAQAMNGQRLAFLDSAASAQKPYSVIDAMNAVYETGYANIHRGLYQISQALTENFEAVRRKVASFIDADTEKSIVFTRNTTEAINLIAQSWGGAHLKAGDEVILSEMEHHANIVPWQLLAAQKGIVIRWIRISKNGELDLDHFQTLLSTKTKLVSVVHISNALGTVNDVYKIINLARKFNPKIKVLIDGSQSVVHSPVHMQKLDTDFFVFTGHKLYGPTGIGVLYGKPEVLESMPPYQGGGDMIDSVTFSGSTYKEPPYRFEAGTPAITEVIGLGAAIDYVEAIGFDAITAHETKLRNYTFEKLSNIEGLKLYGPDLQNRAGIFSFNLAGAHSSDIGMILDKTGVAVRTGHHCCMPLMSRLGIDGTVRASLALYSDQDDIDQLVEGLHKARELLS